MKTVYAAVFSFLVLSSPVFAQGYDGLIAPPKNTQVQQQYQQPQAGYGGVVGWDDKSGGTAYGADADLYNFVGSSGADSKLKEHEKRYKAQLQASEEIKRKAAERRQANTDALKQNMAEKQAAYDKELEESRAKAEELQRQQEDLQLQQEQTYR